MRKVSDSNFDKMISGDKVVVVMVSGEFCPLCSKVKPIFECLDKKFKKAKFFLLDIESGSRTASRYSISTIPVVLVFKGGGLQDMIVKDFDEIADRIQTVVASK